MVLNYIRARTENETKRLPPCMLHVVSYTLSYTMVFFGATLLRHFRHKSAAALHVAESAILTKKSLPVSSSASGVNRGHLRLGIQFVREYSKASKMSTLPRVFFDMTADGEPLGRIIMEVSVTLFLI